MRENEIVPRSYTNHKNWLKIDPNVNIRHDTLKLLEENIGKKILDISLGSDFFAYNIKRSKNKSKSEQVGLQQT